MPGRAADAVLIDDRGKFEAQAHRLGDLGLPGEFVAIDLAVAPHYCLSAFKIAVV